MSRPHAADDFAAIRGWLEELRRERDQIRRQQAREEFVKEVHQAALNRGAIRPSHLAGVVDRYLRLIPCVNLARRPPAGLFWRPSPAQGGCHEIAAEAQKCWVLPQTAEKSS